MKICAATDCQHGQIAHRYLHGTGANTGECLCPGCPCGDFEEGE
jgi:hypothetical protein